MNQRIRELALEAGAQGIVNRDFIDIKKFAQLIVRDCLELTLGKDRKQLLDKGDLDGANLVQKDIVRVIKHFGVEE